MTDKRPQEFAITTKIKLVFIKAQVRPKWIKIWRMASFNIFLAGIYTSASTSSILMYPIAAAKKFEKSIGVRGSVYKSIEDEEIFL